MTGSRYLDAFKTLVAEFGDRFVIFGDEHFVEEVPKEDIRTAGGIHLPSNVDGFGRNHDGLEVNRAIFCRVVASGPGHVDDAGKTWDTTLRPGDVILVSPNSVLWFQTFLNNVSTMDRKIGVVREKFAHSAWRGDETYDVFRARLKELLDNKKEEVKI